MGSVEEYAIPTNNNFASSGARSRGHGL